MFKIVGIEAPPENRFLALILAPSDSIGGIWSALKGLRTAGLKIAYYARPPLTLDEVNRRLEGTGVSIVWEGDGDPPVEKAFSRFE